MLRNAPAVLAGLLLVLQDQHALCELVPGTRRRGRLQNARFPTIRV